MVYTLDPNNSVIKRFWCTWKFHKKFSQMSEIFQWIKIELKSTKIYPVPACERLLIPKIQREIWVLSYD